MAGKTVISADVLIIGGGLAGAMAAAEAAKYGCRVVLADKGVLGRSGSSCTAGGAIAFPSAGPGTVETGDSKDYFYEDVIRGGEGISDPDIVRVMVDEVMNRVRDLESMGILFQRLESGHYYQRQGLGHRFLRSCSPVGAGSGLMMGLRREVLHRGVTVLDDTGIFHLFKKDGAVVGAAGVNSISGELFIIGAGAVVMAAGSVTGLYSHASTNFPTHGDSFAMALEAGAVLANLEFVEFTFIPAPKGIVISSGGATPFPSRGALLYNALGERFMARYDPARMEKSTRAKVVQAMEMEMREGRGPVFMDASMVKPELRHTVETEVIRKIKSAGVDPWSDRFEWVTAVHSALGGVVISTDTSTGVPGLYACGESATGVHGANRLSGVALAECAVFGHRAGKYAALYALKEGGCPLPLGEVGELEKRMDSNSKGGEKERESCRAVLTELQKTARESIGVFRDAQKLSRATERFGEIVSSLPENSFMEIRNLALAGRLIALCAARREESRGQHMREDFPQLDKKWENRSVRVSKAGNEFLVYLK